jgi:hypothetical protein
MARGKPIRFETVMELGRQLPGVEATTSWGAPALKVRGKMFACQAIHKSAEPDTLVVRMDFAERDELIAEDPHSYYLTDHYVDYACVLVRLLRVDRETLRDLLSMGWRFMSRSDPRVRRRRATGRGGPVKAHRAS